MEGQIFDGEGRPLPALRVQIIERTGGSVIPGIRRPVAEIVVATAETDGAGFYSVDLGARRFRGDVLVRFHDAERWDALRYEPAQDRKITRDLRRKEHVVANCSVADARGWAELAHEIERAGGVGTKRGQILRRHGMPQETVSLEGGVVEWRYPGVIYVFRNGELVESKRRDKRPVRETATRAGA